MKEKILSLLISRCVRGEDKGRRKNEGGGEA